MMAAVSFARKGTASRGTIQDLVAVPGADLHGAQAWWEGVNATTDTFAPW
jgi:hypothetical protein